jgi:Fic family protein
LVYAVSAEKGKPMLFSYDYQMPAFNVAKNKEKILMTAAKMLPEYVFDTSQLENNPVTFPEVKTLLDGVTVGGHKISDVQQILNIRDAWLTLFDDLKSGRFTPSKETFHKINRILAKDEAIYAGAFRNGSVSIAGTRNYKAPDHTKLDDIFDSEIPQILSKSNVIEQAVCIFLQASLNQFYWDGNKRTARLIANGILINEGIGVFNISTKDILEFNTLMIDFYETARADNIVRFLVEKCIIFGEP